MRDVDRKEVSGEGCARRPGDDAPATGYLDDDEDRITVGKMQMTMNAHTQKP